MEADILEKFRNNGFKITPQRSEILKVFLDSGSTPLSAEEIHRIVIVRYPNISLDTVYRNLNIFLELEVVSRHNFLNNKSVYELSSKEQHYHHLVCLKCSKAKPVDYCPFDLKDIKRLEIDNNFIIKKHNFNIFGYCQDCSH